MNARNLLTGVGNNALKTVQSYEGIDVWKVPAGRIRAEQTICLVSSLPVCDKGIVPVRALTDLG